MLALSAEGQAAIEKKRQRSNKISNLMGQYLLKGWRMLAEHCPVCDTVLFLNKDGNTYCVACSEVDNALEPHQNTPIGDVISSTTSNDSACNSDGFCVIDNEQKPKVDLATSFSNSNSSSRDPPTKETGDSRTFEQSSIEIYRAERNKIAELLGAELLKGHRMTDLCCPRCTTILMQNRDGETYCVGCPLTDDKKKVAEGHSSSPLNQAKEETQLSLPVEKQFFGELPKPQLNDLTDTQSSIEQAIRSCSQQIIGCSSSLEVERYANAIKSLSEALVNLKRSQ